VTERTAGEAMQGPTLVLVPVKSLQEAKRRLSPTLTPHQRAQLARTMAGIVLSAAAPLPVGVVCDDDEVAAWARSQGAAVVWTPGLGLNGALDAAVARAAGAGVERVVVVHADLPFARDLGRFADARVADEVVLVPDRHHDGTNVLAMDPRRAIPLGYGAGSFERHRRSAERAGLAVRVVEDDALSWDVDGPDDLCPPQELGTVPLEGGR
jgi:2-phospho-L-lactate guanylyltransferase